MEKIIQPNFLGFIKFWLIIIGAILILTTQEQSSELISQFVAKWSNIGNSPWQIAYPM